MSIMQQGGTKRSLDTILETVIVSVGDFRGAVRLAFPILDMAVPRLDDYQSGTKPTIERD
jgi:hypothetical protein